MANFTVKEFKELSDFYISGGADVYEQADNLVIDDYAKLISRPGLVVDFPASSARARVPLTASTRRIGLMFGQTTGVGAAFTLVKQVGDKLQYDNGSAMTELVGPAPAAAFTLSPTNVSESTLFSSAEWSAHTFVTHESPWQKPLMVYRDSGGVLRLRTAGLTPTADTYTATGGSGANYIYALVRKYTYTVGDVTYIMRSAPQFKDFTNIGTATASSSPGITVGSIPVLSNTSGAGEHYDTSVIKVEVYRTTNNGQVLYYVGEVTNGTTSYSDTTTDDALVDAEPLYTESGEAENLNPPKCKFVHATTDVVVWANGFEVNTVGGDGDYLPNRVWFSKPGAGWAVPGEFHVDAEEAVVGVSSVNSVPLIFCKGCVYRADGQFDALGRGGVVLKKINDKVGCVNNLSIVQSMDGVFFAGQDGFYFTDGYKVQPLSGNYRKTYRQLVNTSERQRKICGTYDVINGWVLWAVRSEKENTNENGRIFCFNTERMSITTWSSGFDGSSANEIKTGSVSGTTITFSDITDIKVGDRVVLPAQAAAISCRAHVVSIDSATAITISENGGTIAGTSVEFLRNEKGVEFYRNFEPTALCCANDKVYIGTRLGYTLCIDEDRASVSIIDVAATPSTWVDSPIFFNYDSAAFDLGSTEVRKYVTEIILKARPRSDITSVVSVQIKGENDDSGIEHSLEPISFQAFYPWGTPLLQYGDPKLYRRIRSMVDVRRKFPAGQLRCEYKQIGLEMGYVIVDRSGISALAGTAAGSTAVLKNVTLTAPSSWDTGIENYWISFEDDNYTQEYRILTRNSNTSITVLDPSNLLTTGLTGKKWVMRGYPKDALVQLMEYTLRYEMISSSQDSYLGENKVSQ